MAELINSLPTFWRDALHDPGTWGFWDWVFATASFLAIVSFIWIAWHVVWAWLKKLLRGIFIWTANARMDQIYYQEKSLIESVNEAMRWRKRSHRLTAFVANFFTTALIFLAGGFFSLIALPDPFAMALGSPLVGLAILRLLNLRRAIVIATDCKRYVDRETKAIESNLKRLEKTIPDDHPKNQWIIGLVADSRSLNKTLTEWAEAVDASDEPGVDGGKFLSKSRNK